MGRRLLTNYMSRRFGDEQPWIAKPLLLNYLLGIWCRSPKSAGGYMVQALMAVGGIPKGSQDAVLSAIRGAANNGTVLVTAPFGAGFGRHYGAHAKIFKRVTGVKLPQDEDYIEIWAPGQ
ncbi:hypothetical protein Ctob_009889 [Chrysochromulina tobinii]|uniref:Uncharacterized protein n=1 Tax=Chrysochromulina tobinii TaxID=1460289 RepID=A0A0M0JHP4_9EUKA|nr:hypothetical protein Ctob_009889 [Chrysochromulina tobinii]|eukprot:KOO25975.1 hypothetical protein Ctob_009889 [Chrysochromulina sp. CCMP291]